MAKGSRKKIDALAQTHGALAAAPDVDMNKVFGLPKTYTESTVEEYKEKIKAMTTLDLHAHSVDVRVTPVDNRDKLERKLETRFVEAKTAAAPIRKLDVKTSTDPKVAAEFKRFMHGA